MWARHGLPRGRAGGAPSFLRSTRRGGLRPSSGPKPAPSRGASEGSAQKSARGMGHADRVGSVAGGTSCSVLRVLNELGEPATLVVERDPAEKAGVRSGLPDVMVIFALGRGSSRVKSRGGLASRAQKRVRDELLAVGCEWWLCRSAHAALTALHRSGVKFRRPWRAVPLEPWEGPFTGAERRLPQHPAIAARQREACRRWREKKRAHVLEAAAREDAGPSSEAA
jgi:hypothetical protein